MIKPVFNLILSITLGIFVLFSSNIKDTYYRKGVGSDVVRVYKVDQSTGGTGFHVKAESGNVYILTNKHVCSLADKYDRLLIEQNGKKVFRRVVARYPEHDLCVVEPLSKNHSTLSIASRIFEGEDIIVVGHPGLRSLTLAHGEYIGSKTIEISSLVDSPKQCAGRVFDDPMTYLFTGKLLCLESFRSSAISSPIYGGNSGSPVVNKFGNVVGVVFAGNRSQSNDGYMVPLQYVKEFLKGL